MSELVITVYGTPAPQGSKRHVGNGVMVESSKKVKPWREDVRAAALHLLNTAPIDGEARLILQAKNGTPLDVHITFSLPRPKGHYGSGRNFYLVRGSAPVWPAGRPDIDKLVRSTLDALGSAGIYHDDAQIVWLKATKVYVGGVGALDRPGAIIRITTLTGAA